MLTLKMLSGAGKCRAGTEAIRDCLPGLRMI